MQMLPAGAGSASSGPVLRDIHLPPAPSWWPPAPGWWLLLLLLLIVAVIAALLRRRQVRKQQWRDRVLVELDLAEQRYRQSGDRHALAGDLHRLLRRTAVRLDPAAHAARGEAWLTVLDQIKVNPAVRSQLQALDQAMYQRDAGAQFDPERALVAVRSWMTLALRKLAARHIASGRRAS